MVCGRKCVAVGTWRVVAPTSMSLSGADPTSTSLKTGELGHPGWVEMGLVAMYPKSPSQSCGRRIDRDPTMVAWNTMWWEVDLMSALLERRLMGTA